VSEDSSAAVLSLCIMQMLGRLHRYSVHLCAAAGMAALPQDVSAVGTGQKPALQPAQDSKQKQQHRLLAKRPPCADW
jgi:hypothetical protein